MTQSTGRGGARQGKIEGGQEKGAKMPAGSWSRRAHGRLQLCNESQRLQQTLHQAGISSHTDPESSSQGTSPPSNTSMDALPPPTIITRGLNSTALAGSGSSLARHGPRHLPKEAGWGRQASLYKDGGTQGFFRLEQRNRRLLPSQKCFPGPKTAYRRAAPG